MSYTKPSKSFSSILNSRTLSNKSSLHGILRDVKKAGTGLTQDKQIRVAKIIKKLNDDPNAVVTNIMSKTAIQALGAAGHLQSKYQDNLGAAIVHVQKAKQEAFSTSATSGSVNDVAQGTISVKPMLSDSEKRRQEAKHKILMWAQARERQSEGDKNVKVVRSLGLNEWQKSAASISKSIKEKEQERKRQAEADQRKKAVDLMID